ncbi:VOC family protein [Spirulina subsalsa FACHB-351]|uniref:VOC family protein n=1 Tax=Spirulina subsalsa FACHB-351 TaxID=234711 RepID=A0ABT3L6E6_9CYAN|nr:VOC family protein [Spirulina subsalsa]MCW6037083.1 VOC family protein [Spirulina subsalsa FACHB-351]
MKILECLHTAILVSDLERAQDFYQGILGLAPVDRVLKFPGIWYQVGQYQIHLIVSPDFQASLQEEAKWGRNSHIAFSVDDLEALAKGLEAQGYSYQKSASGRAALFVRDPDGNVVEVSQSA